MVIMIITITIIVLLLIIFKGIVYPPLPFALCMIPIILEDQKLGMSEEPMCLLFVDSLKLFRKSYEQSRKDNVLI